MASKTTLKSELESLYADAQASKLTDTEFADAMATAIDNYIKTFTVSGSATGVTPGSGTAPVTGTLS